MTILKAYQKDKPILIEHVENGGFVIFQDKDNFIDEVVVGAFTTAADMLDALHDTLVIEPLENEIRHEGPPPAPNMDVLINVFKDGEDDQ